MSILEHRWGVSPGADRVWAQVSGMRPGLIGATAIMALQAFIDESYGEDEGVFVMGGYIGAVEAWAKFSSDWEALLPDFGYLNHRGKYAFKMSEMAWTPERFDRVPAFFRVIEKHSIAAISVSFRVRDMKAAIQRLWVPGRNLNYGYFANPYVLAFASLMDLWASSRQIIEADVPLNERLDFYFDDHSSKKSVVEAWEIAAKLRPEVAASMRQPRFECDDEFLPLQAADFWAWWVREWETHDLRPDQFDFGQWTPKGRPALLYAWANEDELVEGYKDLIKSVLGDDVLILDRGWKDQKI